MRLNVQFRLLLTGIFLAAMLSAIPLAAGETLTCIVADGQYVNVRNQASSTAATWGILHHGDTIETNPLEISRGFFKESILPSGLEALEEEVTSSIYP